MRTVMNGVAVDDVTSVDTHIPRNTWFQVELQPGQWDVIAEDQRQRRLQHSTARVYEGQIGLVTHAAVGQFDNVFVGVPFGDQGFLETFADLRSSRSRSSPANGRS